ncbi:MAG: MerR family transcriptional regulator [Candidatus Coatesbacteria bacterium]|nr:MAG: MerR family transcriptional regulator [Candidatus Coatesbacteria bacterium]
MFKIGEFSKLSKVSVRALRHYDRLRLLEPADVDRWTGYRSYSASQLPRLNRIVGLKEMGFSLDEVAALLDNDLTVEEMRGMLKAKRAELNDRVRDEKGRLARVEARLRLREQEGKDMPEEVVVKKVKTVRAATLRDIIPSYPEQGHLWEELMSHLKSHDAKYTGPCFTMYHDECYKESDVDAEVGQPVASDVPETDRIKMRDVPGAEQMACLIHKGPYDGLNAAYQVLTKWIDDNGYRIVGPDREVYLAGCASTDDPNEYVTEIQFPVEKS